MPDDYRATAIAYYNAARAEVVQRLSLREQVLLAYLATSGVIAGLAFKNPSAVDFNLLLLIPVISLPFTLAFARHDWVIRYIGRYKVRELNCFLKFDGDAKDLRDFTSSKVLDDALRRFLLIEKVIFMALICGPAIAAIAIRGFPPVGVRVFYLWALSSTLVTIGFFLYEVGRVVRDKDLNRSWSSGSSA